MIRRNIIEANSEESYTENQDTQDVSQTSADSSIATQGSEDWTSSDPQQVESEQNVTAQSSSTVSLCLSKPTRSSLSLTSVAQTRFSKYAVTPRRPDQANLPKSIEKSWSYELYQLPRSNQLPTDASISLPNLSGKHAARVRTDDIDQLIAKQYARKDTEKNTVRTKKHTKLLPPLRPPLSIPANPEPPRQELEQFIIHFENKTFVDYFNVFLSLPVFGQHVYYNYLKRTFEFEPPVKRRINIFVDTHEVMCWLYTERYKLFQNSTLYCEYLMANELKNTKINCTGITDNDGETENTSNLSKNLFGSVVGILLFREFLRGTCGESVFSCWREIERWRHLEDSDPEKTDLKNIIKMMYISDTAKEFVSKRSKVLIFQGSFNDELLPDEELLLEILQTIGFEKKRLMLETDKSFLYFQKFLLLALKLYWIKKYVLHLELTAPFELMKKLSRSPAGEKANEARERMLRSRMMFPSVYEKEEIDTSLRSTIITGSSSSPSASVDGSTPGLDSSEWSNGLSSGSLTESDCEEEDEMKQETVNVSPTNLFNLWGGPSKGITLTHQLNTPMSPLLDDTSTVDDDEEEDVGMWSTLTSPRLVESYIPSAVRSFMTGKRRPTFMFRSEYYQITWSLASDNLAGSPFQKFLREFGYSQDLHYLQFWMDLRDYLNTDENCINICGESCRKILSNKIARNYLSGGECSNIFTESLKVSLLRDLSKNNDSPSMFSAQDIAIQALWKPMRTYIQSERISFVNRVQANRLFVPYKRKMKVQAGLSFNHPTYDSNDPMYSFTMTNRMEDSFSAINPNENESFLSPDNNFSFQKDAPSPTEQWKSEILEAQLWRAMELSITCAEYGTYRMHPQTMFSLDDLVDALHAYYGSLHIKKKEPVRKPWLRDLVIKPKIDIKDVRVSRKTIDVTPLKHSISMEEEMFRRGERYYLRREAVVMERPPKPKSLQEVLSSPAQYEFFKRYLIENNALTPLSFWRKVEDLKQLSHIKTIQMKIKDIITKYFGRRAKPAMLDCDDDIIWQIPVLEKVTPAMLVVAQNAVFRSLEKKWYCSYLDTYPRDESIMSKLFPEDSEKADSVKDVVDLLPLIKPKRQIEGKRRRVVQLWSWFLHNLCEFRRSITDSERLTKLETYLECESDQEQKQEQRLGRKNTPTRVVVRNRLVVLARLPQDLWFYVEILKYMSLVDNVYATLCVTHEDANILIDKAKSVIICYLNSEFPPKVQVNIPSEMAYVITTNLEYVGPTRALFHDALMLLFPLLYHYWKKFRQDESDKSLSVEYQRQLQKKLGGRSAHSPHQNITIPNYLNVTVDSIPSVTMPLLEERMKISFSFVDGVRYVYSLSRSKQGSKESKQNQRSITTILSSSESFNSQQESKFPILDESKKDFKEPYQKKGQSSKANLQVKSSQSQGRKFQVLATQA